MRRARRAVIYRLASHPVCAKQVTASSQDSSKEQTLVQLKKELNLSPEEAGEVETVLDDFSMYHQMLSSQMDRLRTQ
jgi:hypothetical protein